MLKKLDVAAKSALILGGVNWFLRWYRADGRLTVDEIADAYIDSIFYGLLAPTLPASVSAAAPGRPAAASIRRLKRRGKPGATGS